MRDVADVLGVPVLATVSVRSSVARDRRRCVPVRMLDALAKPGGEVLACIGCPAEGRAATHAARLPTMRCATRCTGGLAVRSLARSAATNCGRDSSSCCGRGTALLSGRGCARPRRAFDDGWPGPLESWLGSDGDRDHGERSGAPTSSGAAGWSASTCARRRTDRGWPSGGRSLGLRLDHAPPLVDALADGSPACGVTFTLARRTVSDDPALRDPRRRLRRLRRRRCGLARIEALRAGGWNLRSLGNERATTPACNALARAIDPRSDRHDRGDRGACCRSRTSCGSSVPRQRRRRRCGLGPDLVRTAGCACAPTA